MTRDFSLSSVLRRMGGAGGSGYEIGVVLTCHSPSLVMNFPKLWLHASMQKGLKNGSAPYYTDEEESGSGQSLHVARRLHEEALKLQECPHQERSLGRMSRA